MQFFRLSCNNKVNYFSGTSADCNMERGSFVLKAHSHRILLHVSFPFNLFVSYNVCWLKIHIAVKLGQIIARWQLVTLVWNITRFGSRHETMLEKVRYMLANFTKQNDFNVRETEILFRDLVEWTKTITFELAFNFLSLCTQAHA